MDHLDLINDFIESLPSLVKDSVPEDLCCPICLVSFEDIFKDMSTEIPLGGVTMLPSCRHIFCRNDLTQWIRNMHGSCPSCRRVFLDIRPPSDSDGESSDGGEYLPNEEDEEDEDLYLLDTDDMVEADEFDFEMEEVDLDIYQNWEPSDVEDNIEDVSSEWGLTDGDSLSNSDCDISFESDSAPIHSDDNVIIQQDADTNFDIDFSDEDEK
ncbi:hypothetical protein EV359DRAFT_76472 [Lentinula novae-zelandiae]|nr:hypothetical protein EV359DRAFT_76472 [Lentinula novae-zelandiae]